MKQSLLDSLRGLSVAAAKKLVKEAGHKCVTYPDGTILPSLACRNQVTLYTKDGLVEGAYPGDPLEVEVD